MSLTHAQAMAAVAQHAVDYWLPAPLAIHQPAYGSLVVEVSVAPHALTEWLDAMLVQDEKAEPVSSDLPRLQGMERVVFTGLLGADLVEVELRSVRKIGPRLLAVPA